MAAAVDGVAAKDLQGLVDDDKKQIGSGVVAIVGDGEDGKAGLAVGVTDDLDRASSPPSIWCEAAPDALGGQGGGGRPDMAQAGGPDGSKADDALAAISEALAAG